MSKINVAINGFGRIGRAIAKINFSKENFNLVHINDLNSNIENLAYLLKYDSTYGISEHNIKSENKTLIVDEYKINCSNTEDLRNISFNELEIDVLIDSSGLAGNVKIARELINQKKIKKYIFTHSSNDVDKEIILGVNENELSIKDSVISSSICDANAGAHIFKWIDDKYGINGGSITTLHPWLSYQNLVDGASISQSQPGIIWNDYALGRSSVGNLIPKNTTAMTAIEKVLPRVKDKIISFSYRIPTSVVCSADIVLNLNIDTNKDNLLSYLHECVKKSNYVSLNYESLTSKDYEKNQSSSIIDMQWVEVKNNTAKIIIWYDNEWGYASRVVDLVNKI